MRLLRSNAADGSLSPTWFAPASIPSYAILSHRWESDNQEVTPQDLKDGSATGKLGYKKIRFCANQAKNDGLEYFWVDSCCIDKSNNAELAEAIISMFRWYQNAAKCYVYLGDVPSKHNSWLSDFEKSQWFKRGWTLQELIAPRDVEFYAKDGQPLGTKYTLQDHIHNITGIEKSALLGNNLSTFSIKQRLSWANSRQTTREEDLAYCLLGIFGINMVPLYGEGAKNAMARLKREISALDPDGLQERAKIAAWLSTAPPDHIHEAMQQSEGTCEWIFEDSNWQAWTSSATPSLLWMHGEPGVGKTVLASATINKISSTMAPTATLAHFYCNAGDIEQHKTEAVIASLTKQLLLNLTQSVPDAVQEIYEKTPQSNNVKHRAPIKTLCEILQHLQSCYQAVTYVIDGLDECSEDERNLLLDVVLPLLQRNIPLVKLLLTSRNKDDIATRLSHHLQIVVDVSKNSADIRSFVQSQLSQAVEGKRLLRGQVPNELFLEIVDRLSQDACGMFLWAKLQIPILCSASSERRIRHMLANYPRQLDKQYDRMLFLVRGQEADVVALAINILLWTTFSFRPCTSKELWTAVTAADHITGFEADDLSTDFVVAICHDFLQVNTPQDGVVLIHTSARQYLTKWFGSAAGHGNLASQCARYLSSCGFDRQVEQLLSSYVDPEDVGEPSLPPEERREGFMETWIIIVKMRLRSVRFMAVVDSYPFLAYAGNYWLRHADLGIEHFALSAFPWILNENSSVFASWRTLNSMEGGLLLYVLGDLGIPQLKLQVLINQSIDIVAISAHLGLSKLLNRVLERLPELVHKHRALTAAACAGMVEIVTTLLWERDILNPPGPFRALMMAAPSGHVSVISLLLEAVKRARHGVDDDQFNDCTMIATIGACLSPTPDVIKAVYSICGSQNSLHYDAETVKRVVRVVWNPIPVGVGEAIVAVDEAYEGSGWSPLMIASLRGNEHTVPILLEDGSCYLDDIQYALLTASALRHRAFVKAIIQRTEEASIPLFSKATALACAIALSDEAIVNTLIAGDSPQNLARLFDATPIGLETTVGVAAAVGHVPTMQCLLSHNFSLRLRDTHGKTALHHAVLNGHEDMVQFLLDNTSPEDLRIQDAHGNAPLDVAEARGFDAIAAMLRTALEDAKRNGKKRKLAVLEDGGSLMGCESCDGR